MGSSGLYLPTRCCRFCRPPKNPPPVLRSETRGHGHPTRRLPRLLIFGQGNRAGPSSPAGGGMRPPHGKFPGQAGKIFCGEPTAKSEMTDFWPSLLAWSSMGCSQFFLRLQPLYRSTGYSLRRRRLAITFPSQQGVIPSGGVEIIQEQINRITAKGDARLSLAFAFSLGLALWSANAGMKAVIDALNVTYNEKEKRGFIKLNLISLALTVRCNSIASCSPRIDRGAASDPLLFWIRRMDRDAPAISPLAGADLPRRLRSGRFVSIRSK